jgi:phosphoribosylformimino-5-aminoimidazole carboxamide ribotide isomerase
LRTEGDITLAFSWGIQRVIIGTRALQDPAWVRQMCLSYPDRIVIGLDARNGKVATEGWANVSESDVCDLATEFAAWPVAAFVSTDIACDGMLSGPNFDLLTELVSKVSTPVIASGGVTTIDHVRELSQRKLAGCIIGRALYEGRLDLSAAVAVTAGTTS